jgi:hypothetical protein
MIYQCYVAAAIKLDNIAWFIGGLIGPFAAPFRCCIIAK